MWEDRLSSQTRVWLQDVYKSPFARKTYLVLLLVMIVDKADQMLVPSVYLELGEEFGVGPAFLGTVTLFRGLAQALVALLSGPVGKRYDRVAVSACGVCFWGVATLFVGAAPSITVLILARTMNGVGLGLVIPLVQALTSDMFPNELAGRAFGLLGFMSNLGGSCGAFLAVSLAARSEGGWRYAFYIVGFSSIAIGLLLYAVGEEPRGDLKAANVNEGGFSNSGEDGARDRDANAEGSNEEGVTLDRDRLSLSSTANPLVAASSSEGSLEGLPADAELEETGVSPIPAADAVLSWDEMKRDTIAVLRLRTFQCILAQGAFGEMPWYAMNFMVMWLELRGFSHTSAAAVRVVFDLGVTMGNVIGGVVSDWSERVSPDHGRVAVAQFTVFIGIPTWLLILFGLPSSTSDGTAAVYGLVGFTTAALISWAYATKSTIMSEIVLQEVRSTVYALDRVGEGTISAASAPLVGFLAESAFGYDESRSQHANGASLARAMAISITVPWAICFVVWTLAQSSYGPERDAVRLVSLDREKRQQQQQQQQQQRRRRRRTPQKRDHEQVSTIDEDSDPIEILLEQQHQHSAAMEKKRDQDGDEMEEEEISLQGHHGGFTEVELTEM